MKKIFLLLLFLPIIGLSQSFNIFNYPFIDVCTSFDNWIEPTNKYSNAYIIESGIVYHFFEKGYQNKMLTNTINDFNPSNDYEINFWISNINDSPDYTYGVLDSSKKDKSKQASNPNFGILLGFKDWDNYFALDYSYSREYNTYVTGNYIYYINTKIYFEKNGIKKSLINTKTRVTKSTANSQGEIGFSYKISKVGQQLKIFRGNDADKELLYSGYTKIPWSSKRIGLLAGAGAKTKLKYLSIQQPNDDLPSTNYTESSLKKIWEENGLEHPIEGIYERVSGKDMPGYKLAVKNTENELKVIYLDGNYSQGWRTGDVKALLEPTATPNLYTSEWLMGSKKSVEKPIIGFSFGLMECSGDIESTFIKTYPNYPSSDDEIPNFNSKASGTGFAINSQGYIITNYHVIEDANNILVSGLKGDFNREYNAEVVIFDRNNDLAVLKVNSNLGPIPYLIENEVAKVATEVFALGYPLRATMGDEIKFSKGDISSRSGFKGDITNYQHSAPIQPGNSGGPLFNNNGSLIGIINAKHSDADNVSYAIKSKYLLNLLSESDELIELPSKSNQIYRDFDNYLKSNELPDLVSKYKNYVYIIETN